MQLLFKAICQMGIFVICAQTIIHFRPNGSYEKYFRLLVSVMILLQIFLPVSRLFTNKTGEKLEDRIQWYSESMEKSMQEASEGLLRPKDQLEQILRDEVDKSVLEKEQQTDIETNSKDRVNVEPIPKIHISVQKLETAEQKGGIQN